MQLDIMHPHRKTKTTQPLVHVGIRISVGKRWEIANGAISTFRKRDCVAFIGGMRTTGRSNWNFVENVYLFR